jgi:hypothetical protein
MMKHTSMFVAVAAMVLGLAASADARSDRAKKEPRQYFYMITEVDKSLSLQVMTEKDAAELKKSQIESYREERKEWSEARKKWMAATGSSKYPVPKPSSPRIKRLTSAPTEGDALEKARDRQERKFKRWNVCVVKDVEGGMTAASIRRDKMYARQVELLGEYAEALAAYAAEIKEDPEVKKDPNRAPKKPGIKVYKGNIADADNADKWVEKYTAKLDKLAEKKAREEDKRAAEAEKKAAAEEKRGGGGL